MNRYEFQELSRIRLRESRSLFTVGHFDGAYYLAGYSIECALKACIARRTKRHDFPDKKAVDKSYTHNLEQLVAAAELKPLLDAEIQTNQAFALGWAVAKDWTEESRYERRGRQQARDLLRAVGARSGVLAWVRRYW